MVGRVIVHGGAGLIQPERYEAARAGCRLAVEAGLAVLGGGGSAMDAAIAAVRALEDDPAFNAGVGAVLTRDETVELDASVMEGATLRFGAIAGVPNVRRPIDLARAILEDGEHVLMAGEVAWAFARELGFEPCDPAELITERSRERLREEAARRERGNGPDKDLGTVGAVAIDDRGRVVAATSTGGTTYKRRGRIGDTPLIGCGTYADDTAGGASATGHGESLIRATTSLTAVEAMRGGADARAAAWHAIDELERRVRGDGGIICVDREGRVGAAHNTTTMAWGAGRVGGAVVADVSIERDRDVT